MVLPNSRGDVHVEGGGDEDRGGEAEEEQKGEVVHDELIWLYCASWLDILQKQKALDLAMQNLKYLFSGDIMLRGCEPNFFLLFL